MESQVLDVEPVPEPEPEPEPQADAVPICKPKKSEELPLFAENA